MPSPQLVAGNFESTFVNIFWWEVTRKVEDIEKTTKAITSIVESESNEPQESS